MIALRLLLVVALAFTVNAGDDLTRVYELLDCFRKVTIEGIPSADIPSYDPFRLSRTVHWNGSIGLASAKLDVSNIEWYGIPTWHASIEQISRDSDSVAAFNLHIFWDKFVFSSKYDLDVFVGLLPANFNGALNVTTEGNFWKGNVNFTKPGFNETVGIKGLNLLWTAESVNFNFTGLGAFSEPYSQAFSSLAKAYLDSESMGNFIGKELRERVNTYWFGHKERLDAVSEFCTKS